MDPSGDLITDKADQMFQEAGWVFEGDRNCFVSPSKRCTLDRNTVIMLVAENSLDVLKEFIEEDTDGQEKD